VEGEEAELNNFKRLARRGKSPFAWILPDVVSLGFKRLEDARPTVEAFAGLKLFAHCSFAWNWLSASGKMPHGCATLSMVVL
jgi:hypothetical protein